MAQEEPTNYLFAGPGLGIRYIGKDYCYAFSGAVAALDSEQTVLDFTTTGSGYIMATFTMTAPIRMTTAAIAAGYVRGYQLTFNNQTVGLYKADSAAPPDMPSVVEAQILIPPFTAVILSCVDSGANAAYLGTANITGRVYGTE